MKIRECYVSNSSSSSFIISYDPESKAILRSDNGVEIVCFTKDFIREMDSKNDIHGESSCIERAGYEDIYEYAKEWWEEKELKELKNFLDKNPNNHKLEIQISYDDSYLKRWMLSLYKLGLLDVYAEEDDLTEDY